MHPDAVSPVGLTSDVSTGISAYSRQRGSFCVRLGDGGGAYVGRHRHGSASRVRTQAQEPRKPVAAELEATSRALRHYQIRLDASRGPGDEISQHFSYLVSTHVFLNVSQSCTRCMDFLLKQTHRRPYALCVRPESRPVGRLSNMVHDEQWSRCQLQLRNSQNRLAW